MGYIAALFFNASVPGCVAIFTMQALKMFFCVWGGGSLEQWVLIVNIHINHLLLARPHAFSSDRPETKRSSTCRRLALTPRAAWVLLYLEFVSDTEGTAAVRVKVPCAPKDDVARVLSGVRFTFVLCVVATPGFVSVSVHELVDGWPRILHGVVTPDVSAPFICIAINARLGGIAVHPAHNIDSQCYLRCRIRNI